MSRPTTNWHEQRSFILEARWLSPSSWQELSSQCITITGFKAWSRRGGLGSRKTFHSGLTALPFSHIQSQKQSAYAPDLRSAIVTWQWCSYSYRKQKVFRADSEQDGPHLYPCKSGSNTTAVEWLHMPTNTEHGLLSGSVKEALLYYGHLTNRKRRLWHYLSSPLKEPPTYLCANADNLSKRTSRGLTTFSELWESNSISVFYFLLPYVCCGLCYCWFWNAVQPNCRSQRS
jgi:hypothetical protein